MIVKTIVLENRKQVITIITDKHNGVKVKGVATCRDGDTFDAELGTKLSTLYAKERFHQKRAKLIAKSVRLHEKARSYYEMKKNQSERRLNKATQAKEANLTTIEAIQKETAELLKTI